MIITDATNLPRLMACNGSRLMAASLPSDTDHTRRDEGNAADWLAVQGFNGAALDALCNTKAPNGWVITSDMVDHVNNYLSALDCGTVQVVTTFATERWQVNARADHISWRCHPNDQYETPAILTVDDLKYGHRIVEPENNWTLIAHAIGWCIANQAAPEVIILRIHQPRAYHPDGTVREWRLTYDELMSYYQRIDETLSNPSDMLNTGDHCTYCHAAPTCPANRMAGYNGIDASTLAYNDDISVDVLNYELDMLERAKQVISSRLEALTELAIHRIRQGEPNQRRAIETKHGNTTWKPGYKPEFLSTITGVDCTKPGTITPAEFLRRGGSRATYETLTYRPTTGTKLVRVDADERARRLLNKE